MATDWFVLRGEKTSGPFSSKQLKSLAKSGRLKTEDLIRKGSEGKFFPIVQIKGLFEPSPEEEEWSVESDLPVKEDEWSVESPNDSAQVSFAEVVPRVQLPSGVRHPEIEVDEFFRQRASPANQQESRNSPAERIAGALEEVANRLPNLAGPPMTVDQVAKFASVSEKTIYRWVGTGKLKPKADGARPLLFERSEVDKALSRS